MVKKACTTSTAKPFNIFYVATIHSDSRDILSHLNPLILGRQSPQACLLFDPLQSNCFQLDPQTRPTKLMDIFSPSCSWPTTELLASWFFSLELVQQFFPETFLPHSITFLPHRITAAIS